MGSEHGQTVITDLPGDRWLVSLEGEHDLSTAEDLSDKLRTIFRTGTTVVIDLSRTRFVDSSTIGVLVKADRYAQEHDCEQFGIVIAEDSPPERLFALVGVNGMFTTFASAEEAFRHFEAAAGSTDAAAESADVT
jgi:anti-anti-sigma factor